MGDADLQRALRWFLDFLGGDDWKRRVAAIEENIETGIQPKPRDSQLGDFVPIYSGTDRIGWYLYLLDSAQRAPLKYEPLQGSRVIPIFKRLGADLDLLKGVGGVEERVGRLVNPERSQPDGGLFELLIALLWKRNGYTTVEFIPESSRRKTPDLRARSVGDEWFIECKRLEKSSEYSERERAKWLAMWRKFAEYLGHERIALVFEMTFHVELESLPDDYLMSQLAGKLRFLSLPGQIVSNDTWDVTVKPVDYGHAAAHLKTYRVRVPSDQAQELLAGYRDPRRGFSCVIEGGGTRMGDGMGQARFLDTLSFAACSFWDCDAPEAIVHKARNIRRHVGRAAKQLPGAGKCAVHVGLETLDGPVVEQARFGRIMKSMSRLNSGKDLRWIYCHLFESYAPPDQSWVIDETVVHFGRRLATQEEPLASRWSIVPEDEASSDGLHWLKAPP